MAPLGQAKKTTFLKARDDGTKIYSATMDPEWTIHVVPFGGFTLSLVLNAAIQYQQHTAHEDVIYITCFFLKAVVLSAERTELHVKPVRPGKTTGRFMNLKVDLFQDDVLKVTANLIFGSIPLETGPNLPSSHRPKCPLTLHPATAQTVEQFNKANFAKHTEWAVDKSVSKDGDGVVFGCWTGYADKSGTEKLEADTLGVFLDITISPFSVIADDPNWKGMNMWLPTLVMSLEFKVKLPLQSCVSESSPRGFAPTTLGQFNRKSHLRNGRYTDIVELWTAPCNIGDKECVVDEKWRERMVCVAVGGQMGLLVPAELNQRHSSPPDPKL
ncbi:hypothetical protein FRB98_008532 [Tulasnella sp. 332]|nr:hypothetical protein FRB98_008532 [Tulasnella sp. 332]